METLERGKDKIKEICAILKNETLQPAQEEAQKVIELAEQEAHQIIRRAESQGEEILQKAQEKMEKEKKLFQSSLKHACDQGKEALRQDLMETLFQKELVDWVEKQTQDPEVGAKLLQALIEGVEKEGLSVDFSAFVAKSVPSEKVNALLGQKLLERLREGSVTVADFVGGVQLKLHDRKLTLDLSDQAIVELLAKYIRKDFRQLLFGA
ncbi:MAG: V-type proton ATPase subunit E [Chlamydiae bacterium]|nr:V-type proton ATPase subunit E [Chlamydiota bacterium]